MKILIVAISFFALVPALYARGSSTEASIRIALASGKPTMVVFGGEGCQACQQMKPGIEKIVRENQGKAHVICVDIWKEPSLGKYYFVQAIPTLVFYDTKGKEIKRHLGAVDDNEIRRILLSLMTK